MQLKMVCPKLGLRVASLSTAYSRTCEPLHRAVRKTSCATTCVHLAGRAAAWKTKAAAHQAAEAAPGGARAGKLALELCNQIGHGD